MTMFAAETVHGREVIKVNTPERTCRSCKYFVRVHREDEGFTSIVSCLGFCALAKGGDYSLSLHHQAGPECHVYDKYAAETEAEEAQIRKFMGNLKYGAYDRRTKEYRAISAVHKAALAEFDAEDHPPIIRVLRDDLVMTEAVKRYTVAVCDRQLMWLHNRRHMKYSDYKRMVGFIQFTILNEIEPILTATEVTVEGDL